MCRKYHWRCCWVEENIQYHHWWCWGCGLKVVIGVVVIIISLSNVLCWMKRFHFNLTLLHISGDLGMISSTSFTEHTTSLSMVLVSGWKFVTTVVSFMISLIFSYFPDALFRLQVDFNHFWMRWKWELFRSDLKEDKRNFLKMGERKNMSRKGRNEFQK